MDNQVRYTKLGALTGQTFTVQGVNGYKWKAWLDGEKRFRSEDKHFEGASKKWELDTDKGKLDLGTGQFGNLLEAVYPATVLGATFKVNTNGKDGTKEVRYYLNPVTEPKDEVVPPEANLEIEGLW